jgi:hypothetical protein
LTAPELPKGFGRSRPLNLKPDDHNAVLSSRSGACVVSRQLLSEG